ncbi:DUF2231 domain-containing protein [Pseudonocardia sp. GCM10023141]|uniref:DUF2231 domain-containing protein n=1 Tax=Pseudonocardia sp. GCM10023141 TaxID=3252653 RepID=UPI003607E40E
MPALIDGLPLHVLVVHAVVVLVPLAVLGSIAVVLWPAARRRYGWLVVAVAAVATVCIPVATSSGDALEHRLPRTLLIEAHARLGGQLLIFVAGLLVSLAAFMAIHRLASVGRGARGPGTVTATAPPRMVAGAIAALTIVLAVVSAVQVYRIGDSGAGAAWSDTRYIAPTPMDS